MSADHSPAQERDRRYAVLVPIKLLHRAKTRLGAVPAQRRRSLALAFVLDTVTAALAAQRTGAVLVVTDDPDVARQAVDLGASVVPDGVGGDLNGSLVQAAAEAARRWPSWQPVALCADLPALRPDALDDALAAVTDRPAVVPDHSGTGTTLFTAGHPEFRPRFGPGSLARHVADGAVVLPAAERLRQDVDEPDDLARVLALGVGPHTAAVLDDGDGTARLE